MSHGPDQPMNSMEYGVVSGTKVVVCQETNCLCAKCFVAAQLARTENTLDSLKDESPSATNSEHHKCRQLSFCEAFYQATVAQTLQVFLAADAECAASQMHLWQYFTRLMPAFESHYVVYLHFRVCQWTVKSGLNYGAQYVLYRGSPDDFHSEYIVYIPPSADMPCSWHLVQVCSRIILLDLDDEMRWLTKLAAIGMDIKSLTRLAEDVKKTVLICQVTKRGDDATATPSNDDGRDPFAWQTGMYNVGGQIYEVTALAIRFFDVASLDTTIDASEFHFKPQQVIHKKKKKQSKKRLRKLNPSPDVHVPNNSA